MRPALYPILFGRPGWALPGAVIDMDFANGRYYGGSLYETVSTSRASTGYATTAAGVLVPFSANVLRVTDQGALIEEARTNKCTNYNANPTDLTNVTKSGDAAATLAVVDDTAALLAAGLQNIATSGKVYKLDNSAGTTNAIATFGGTTGNTNVHAFSAWGRFTGTAGANRVQMTGVASANFAGATYARASGTGTTGTSGQQIAINAIGGAVVYFILNQLEEGAFVTSPIVIAGASATRAADVPQLIGPALTAALNAKAAFFQTYGVYSTGGLDKILLGMNTATFALYYPLSPVNTAYAFYSGANRAQATLGSGAITDRVKSAFSYDGSGSTVIANAGSLATNATAVAGNTGTPYLGNRSAGDRALNGYMQRFALSPIKDAFDGATSP